MDLDWDQYFADLAPDQRELFMDGFEAATSIVQKADQVYANHAEKLLLDKHAMYLKALRQPPTGD